jgi:MFS family permease
MTATYTSGSKRRWFILALIGLAQLMVVLDVTIVNIALPSAQKALGFSDDSRQWIVTAYALSFGSLLLLGGRVGDLFGRKRVFVTGLAGFAIASAVGGVAQSFGVLVVARALQGGFAALLAPAALSLLTTTFTVPSERNKAFGVVRRHRRLRRGGRPDPGRRADRVPGLALVHVREPDPRDPRRDRRAAPPR